MDSDHLDIIALDAARTGSGSSAEQAHLEGCARCRSALDDLGRLAVEIQADQSSITVPAAREASILAAARARLGGMGLRRRPFVRRAAWTAAAAAIVAAALLLWNLPFAVKPRLAREDLDRSGRVDIVDAYVLALELRAGRGAKAEWDVNGDGRVDGADVDAIARQSVAIARGRP